jgi:predicted dehydrogenase
MLNWKGQLPEHPRPIILIGAGGIVNTAHLPAYKMAGFKVEGIYDIDSQKAKATAAAFDIPTIYSSLSELLQQRSEDSVFDIAVPGSALIDILQQLPPRSAALLQKPMGENFQEAKKILDITREKELIAAVNFQLRYAPFITELREMLKLGMLGELADIEINVNVHTPWNLWEFLFTSSRVEILYHSIHYIDLVRSFFGNPKSVYAKTTKHPLMKELASVRSNIILDYGDMIRANILTNHCHLFGPGKQQSYIKFEGTKGAVKIGMGLLMDYPAGQADTFEYITRENGNYGEWKSKVIEGSWFPHAFIGSMAQLMLAAEGSIERPDNSVEDCIHTMACVEAAYCSSEMGGEKPDC